MAYRIDRIGKLMSPLKTSEGFLLADAYTTRPGVFEYELADGTIRRELRPRVEVYAPRSLASFARKPTCLGHPVDANGDAIRITPDNAREYATGSSSERVEVDREEDKVRMTLTIFDAAHIKAIEDGICEQSLGYDCDLIEEGGVDPEFGEYDAIQTNIVGNHVATVERGRAGRSVRLRADSACQVLHEEASQQEPEMKIKIRRKKTSAQRADARTQQRAKQQPGKPKAPARKTRRDADEPTADLDDEPGDAPADEEVVEMSMEEALPEMLAILGERFDQLDARFDALEGRLDAMTADEDDEPVGDEDEPMGDEDEPTGDEEDEPTGDEEDYTDPPSRGDRRDSARRGTRQDAEAKKRAYYTERRRLEDLAAALPKTKRLGNIDEMSNLEIARGVVKAHLGPRMRNDSRAYVMSVVDTLDSKRSESRASHQTTGRARARAIEARRDSASGDEGRGTFTKNFYGKK